MGQESPHEKERSPWLSPLLSTPLGPPWLVIAPLRGMTGRSITPEPRTPEAALEWLSRARSDLI
jgi:hypothetical protein